MAELSAQQSFPVAGPDGEVVRIPIVRHRGYAAFPASELARLGLRVRDEGSEVRVSHAGGPELLLRQGSPYVGWGREVRQLTAAPYHFGSGTQVPLQLLTDLLPALLPDGFTYDRVRHRLSVADPTYWRPDVTLPRAASARGGADAADPASGRGPAQGARRTEGARQAGGDERARGGESRRQEDRVRVVVIDPGHGGTDPGASGRGGVREKDVALAVGRALARELERMEGFEVHLTRDDDTLVPLWQRGERATRWKGDRPGIFVSIHANAMPSNRRTRGFETYFLAEARTEHARRVAANENAALHLEGQEFPDLSDDPELGFILRELRNLDHQHWSALLAEMVQDELQPVHPGQNRGVKQGPFAVITNALMPAVLVEVGFLTNAEEERLLADPSFQDDAARALARAVRRFFERYPPGGREAS